MGENADHTGHRRRSGHVDASNASMRPRASEQRRVQHAVEMDVIDVSAGTGQQPYVLAPRNRLADVRRHDCHHLSDRIMAALANSQIGHLRSSMPVC